MLSEALISGGQGAEDSVTYLAQRYHGIHLDGAVEPAKQH